MPKPIAYTTNHDYEIVPYSSEWPSWYKDESARLQKVFGDTAVDMQHVGSTAIPGMAAKPQLDILVQMQHIEDADTFNAAMKAEGYEVYGNALGKGGRMYSKWKNGSKIVNLHIYQPDSPIVWEYVAVRDYLLSHPEEAQDYAALKIDLHKKYPQDYLKYREFKDPYIDALKLRIRATE